ncbi:hypothetical protein H2204_005953 [Knufia peltigerae]|uniref:Uncharacterized protein n=1 Tax=Knufia peltigerae TaxID=1002370 RepID=A0AA38Y4J7_9EURO|nr:hypothetical protein H2204_005953 [Knufia peltigerae]
MQRTRLQPGKGKAELSKQSGSSNCPAMSPPHIYGITLANGSTITHGIGANVKRPFSDVPVVMHELDPGTRSFAGQLGFIEFSTEYRLPRHVHIAPAADEASAERRFICERIVVLDGVALVELNGERYVIPPKTLVSIAPGVPHTWTACPVGVTVGEGDASVTSKGAFLMLYEYEEATAFFPTWQTRTLERVEEYERCEDLESIRFPEMSAKDVYEECWFAWDKQLTKKGQNSGRTRY